MQPGPRTTLCFNSLSTPMSAYVAARTYVRFSCTRAQTHARTRGHAYTTRGPPAKRGASARVYIYIYVYVYVCTTSTGTIAGYYRSPRYHGHSSPNAIAYSRLSVTIRASLFAARKFVFLPTIFQQKFRSSCTRCTRFETIRGSFILSLSFCHTLCSFFLRLILFSFLFFSFCFPLIIALSTEINERLKRFVCTDIDYLQARSFTAVRADV